MKPIQPDRSKPDPSAESAWLARARRGDREAQAWLIETYQDAVYGLAFRLVGGDPHRAEELAQETFLRALRALPGFRGEARISTWLHRIVVNLHVNQQSTLASKAARDSVSLTTPEPDSRGDRDFPTPQRGPAEAASRAEEVAQLERCIDTLDPDRRTVLVLRELQGASYEEISELLGLAVGTVRSRLFRARADLRARMNELASTPGRSGR